MFKPKSLAMMKTQPLNNNFLEFKDTKDLTRMLREKHSAVSLQIGSKAKQKGKVNSRISQKAKHRAGSSQGFNALKNLDNLNYANYQHNLPSHHQPVRPMQRKHNKSIGKKVPSMGEHSRGRKEQQKRPQSHKRKAYSHKSKRPTSPPGGTFHAKINGMESHNYK